MPLSWTQRLAQLSSIVGTDPVVDDEERQGQALDEYLGSQEQPEEDKGATNRSVITSIVTYLSNR